MENGVSFIRAFITTTINGYGSQWPLTFVWLSNSPKILSLQSDNQFCCLFLTHIFSPQRPAMVVVILPNLYCCYWGEGPKSSRTHRVIYNATLRFPSFWTLEVKDTCCLLPFVSFIAKAVKSLPKTWSFFQVDIPSTFFSFFYWSWTLFYSKVPNKCTCRVITF